jgi:hypothetical protein
MAAPSVTADSTRESGETVPPAGAGGIGGFISGGPPVPPFAGESAQTAAEGFRAPTAPVRGIEIAKPFGTHTSHVSSTPAEPSLVFAGATMKDLPGVIRDERGVRLAPEAED